MQVMISVVVPLRNEESTIKELHARLLEVLRRLGRPFEIIFIDDGSTDRTFEIAAKIAPLKIIKFRKNFGQTAAIDAGIRAAKGDIILTIDGDLQNDPDDIPLLIAKLEEGYDVVVGWRKQRLDSLLRRLFSRLANWITYIVTKLYLHDHACALKAMRADIFSDIHLYGEMHVFLAAYLHSRGARVTEIPVSHRARETGISKSHFTRAVKANFDLLTLRFLSTLTRPMVVFGSTGAFLFLISLLILAVTLFVATRSLDFPALALIILAAIFALGGLVSFMMGFLAELMLRIYYETKATRPYVIKEVRENK